MIYATVDMGTNTIRLLIARKTGECEFEFLHQESRIARLGEGFGNRRIIKKEAFERALSVLKHYLSLAKSYGAEEIFIAATSAVREAENREWFIEEMARNGFNIDVINPDEEAILTHLGIVYTLKEKIRNKKWVAFDLGGGSTEFMFSGGERLESFISIPLGAVKLLERHILHDPPTAEELNRAAEEFRVSLEKTIKKPDKPFVLVGNAGTVTSLAAIDLSLEHYSYSETEGYRLKKQNIENILQEMLKLKASERLKRYKILEKGREDVIVVGAKVVVLILEFFDADHLIVTNGSLREGLLVEKVCNERKAQKSL